MTTTWMLFAATAPSGFATALDDAVTARAEDFGGVLLARAWAPSAMVLRHDPRPIGLL